MINSINNSTTFTYANLQAAGTAQSSGLSTSQSKYIDIPNSIEKSEKINSTKRVGSDNSSTVQSESNSGVTKDSQREFDSVIRQLKTRDLEVKIHEQAHQSVGGQYVTGGASYVYQVGPDGRRYAVGGEVSIDTSPISGDPEATLIKAQQVQAAALAPAEPSAQDQKVAQVAQSMAAQARSEISLTKESNTDESSSSQADSESNQNSNETKVDRPADQIPVQQKGLPSLNTDRNQFELRMQIA